MAKKRLCLASGSPRRREILDMAGYSHYVLSTDADESTDIRDAGSLCVELSARKAAAAAKTERDCVIVAADTVVELDGIILGKPSGAEEAYAMLTALSGRTHRVHTGCTVTDGERTVSFESVAAVTMSNIEEREKNDYIATGSPLDKAGAYGVQDAGGMFVSDIDGDFYTVMGLPLCKLSQVLADFGIYPEMGIIKK